MLRRIWAVMQKEFIQTLRDRRTLVILISMPMIQLLLFGYAINMSVDHIPTVVFDRSLDSASHAYVDAMVASGSFDVTDYVSSQAQVIEAIDAESRRLGSMIPVILDAKRGDIASTAEAYAKSAFEHLGAHAITLNPYLGKDSIDPFLGFPEKGVFLLCKTSNPGASDLQDLVVDGGPQTIDRESTSTVNGPRSKYLYEHIAYLAQEWNAKNNIGLVVGATQPEALARVRAAALDLWFLSPGVGAQGGDLETALKAGLRKDGKGMLINVSRSIARAENPGLAAAELRDEILNVKRELNR